MKNTSIIVPSNSDKSLIDIAEERIEANSEQIINLIKGYEDPQIKLFLGKERMEAFLQEDIDLNRVFVINIKYKGLFENLGMDVGDGFFRSINNIIVIFFKPGEAKISLEARMVHEYAHSIGLRNSVVTNKDDNLTVQARRVGFGIFDKDNTGLFLEELVASFIMYLYLKEYRTLYGIVEASKGIMNKNYKVFGIELPPRYVILNPEKELDGFTSQLAHFFDLIFRKMHPEIKDDVGEIVKKLKEYRKDAEGIRSFIKNLNACFGKDTYSLLRNINIDQIKHDAIQKIYDLIKSS